jgi:hypothetical protein
MELPYDLDVLALELQSYEDRLDWGFFVITSSLEYAARWTGKTHGIESE